MALVLMEGFDHLTAAQYGSLKGWSGAGGVVTGRFPALPGGLSQAMTFSNSPRNIKKNLPSTYGTLIAGCAFQVSGLGAANDFMILRSTGNTVNAVRLGKTNTDKLTVLNSAGTTIATGTTTLSAGVWYYIEIKAVINGASGTCEVHLNGVSGEIPTTTGNFGSVNLDGILVGQNPGNGSTSQIIDDLYVCDTTGSDNNTFIGDSKITTLLPSADGTHKDWTPDSGTVHFSRVDDTTPDDDTSYVKDSNPGDIDSYVCLTIDPTATVIGVQTNIYARKDDTATREIIDLIRQGGIDYLGATQILSSSYLVYTKLYDKDPLGVDWTAANVNADEFGVKELL